MELSLSSDEEALVGSLRTFVQREVAPVAERMDREDFWPEQLFHRLGDQGFLGITAPPELGGTGLDYRAQALVLLELARESPALALSVGAHSNLCLDNLFRNGSEAQRRKYIPDLASGKHVGALALTEPGAGSDATSIRTRAERKGHRFLINGSKQFITNGPVADLLIVYARTDPARGTHGLSAFLLDKGTPGLSTNRKLDKMGMRGSPTGELSFANVEVPEENLLGKENEGVSVMMSGLNVERAVLTGIPVGIMEACLERSVAYARQREQFGQKIGSFQLIQEKLANMYMDLSASRLLLYEALDSVSRDKRLGRYSSAALTFASEASTRAALQAIQVHGGYGYMRDLPL
ncbi:acyl-CoA dehydrogenase domain-containing protein, partial [mine drainage metagenome]